MKNLQLVLAGCKGMTTDLTVFLSDKEHALFVYLGLASILIQQAKNQRHRQTKLCCVGLRQVHV